MARVHYNLTVNGVQHGCNIGFTGNKRETLLEFYKADCRLKPQILLSELKTAGIHNGDVGKTRSRLEKSAHWKHQRIIVLLPTAETIAAKVALSHWSLLFPPNNQVARILAVGLEVGAAYSTAIEQILLHPELSQWEYILTIETDNMPPQDGVLRLLEQMESHPEYTCIGGLYYTKGEGGQAQIWGDPKDPVLNFRPQLPDPNGGLVECCGTGMGFNLWRMKMFKNKKLRRPWFVTQRHNGIATQDLYAWSDFRKYGYRCAIDCSVRVGHYDLSADTVW